MIKFLKLLCLTGLLCGCSLYHITSNQTAFDYYPQKSSSQDVLYLETISQPHKVIGHVTVITQRSQKKEEVLEQLKHQAAMLGGDAITNITAVDGPKGGGKSKFHLFDNAYLHENYSADVVVFEKPGGSEPALSQ